MKLELILFEPNNPSTLLADKVRIRGVLRGTEPTPVELYCHFADTKLSPEDLSWRSSENELEFSGNVSLSELVPESVKECRDIAIKFSAQAEDSEIFSNESTVTIRPKREWNISYGGFLFPISRSLESDDLIIEGWAAKRGASISRVEVKLGGVLIESPHVNIWSPFVGRTLPDFKEAQTAGFSVGLSRERYARETKLASLPKRLAATVYFSDGSSHFIRGPLLHWTSRLSRKKKEFLEKVQGKNQILLVTNNLSATEGAPKVLETVLKAAPPDLQLNVLSPYDGELRSVFESLGARVLIKEKLQLLHYQRKEVFTASLKDVLLWVEDMSPKVVFGNTVEAFWAIDWAERNGRKNAWLIHESSDPHATFEQLDPVLRINFLKTIRECRRPIFVAGSTARLYEDALGKLDFEIIPNGIDIDAVDSAAAKFVREQVRFELGLDGFCLLSVGTICHRKGHDILVGALQKLRERRTDWICLCVGARETPFLNDLRETIEHLDLGSFIRLIPETSDVSKYYAAADVAVITSREESAPLVSLEALAWGLPLVSTDVFGLKEQLKDVAVLVQPENAMSLCSAIDFILSEEGHRRKMSLEGRNHVSKNFSLDNTIGRYKAMFKKL